MNLADRKIPEDDGIRIVVDRNIKTEDILAGTRIEDIIQAGLEHQIAFAETRALTSDELDTVEDVLKRKAREERSKKSILTQEDGIWFSRGNDPRYISTLKYPDQNTFKGIEFDEANDTVLGRIDITLRNIESARKNMKKRASAAVHEGARLGAIVSLYSAELADESLTVFGRYLRDTMYGKTRLGRELAETMAAAMEFRDSTAIPYLYRKDPEKDIFVPAEESKRLLENLYAWSRDAALPWIKNRAGPSLVNRLARTYRKIRRDILKPVKKSMVDPLADKIRELSEESIRRYYTSDPETGKLILKKEVELGYAHALKKSAPYVFGVIGTCAIGFIAYSSGTDFTRVRSRDPAAAVFRYEPSAEEKRLGANPYDVARKFNEQYDECLQGNSISIHDLRYVNGNSIFRRGAKIPEDYRMKEKQRGLYVKIKGGPCAPKRKR